MSPAAHREKLRHAATQSDWQEAERRGRACGRSLLDEPPRRALARIRDTHRIAIAQHGPSA
jgi:hypothetical protein